MRKKQNIFKAELQRKPLKQSCSCEMECTGNEGTKCKEKCFCHPDLSPSEKLPARYADKHLEISKGIRKDTDKLGKYTPIQNADEHLEMAKGIRKDTDKLGKYTPIQNADEHLEMAKGIRKDIDKLGKYTPIQNADEHLEMAKGIRKDTDKLGKYTLIQNADEHLEMTNFGKHDIDKLRKYFSDWVKSKNESGGTKMVVDATDPKESKLNVVDKIIRRYQHYRKKEEQMKVLEKQHVALKREQKKLQNRLISNKKNATKTIYASNDTDIAFEDQKIPELPINATKNVQRKKPSQRNRSDDVAKEKEVQEIRKQLAYLQQQQDALEKEQGLLSVELQNQRSLFSQASQLANAVLQQGRVPENVQSNLQQFFQGNLFPQEKENSKGVESQYVNNEENRKYWGEQDLLLQLGGSDLAQDSSNQRFMQEVSDGSEETMIAKDKNVDIDAPDSNKMTNISDEDNQDIPDQQDYNQQESQEDLVDSSRHIGYGIAEDVSYINKKTVLPHVRRSKVESRKQNSSRRQHKKKSFKKSLHSGPN